MSAKIEQAREYATNLLVSFVHEHCSPVPEWRPLPDLLGVLTQLDNASTIARDYKAEIKQLRADNAEAHRKLNAIAKHPDVPLLIKQCASGALDGRALEPKP